MSKEEHKLPLPYIQLWLSKTEKEGRGFAVSDEMMPHLDEALLFGKDDANRIISTLMKQREWRFLPCTDIERILFTNNKMF